MRKCKLHTFRDMRMVLFPCLITISVFLGGCTGNVQQQSKQQNESAASQELVGLHLSENGEEYFERALAAATDSFKAEIGGLTEAELGDDAITEEEVPEEVSTPPSGSMFDTTDATEEAASDIEEKKTTDEEPAAEEAETGEDSEEGGVSKVTYYDRAKASEETRNAVTQIVMDETGGEAGYIASYQSRIISMVNELRSNAGLSVLTWDNGAQQVANIRAAEIVGDSEHTRPDGSPWYTVFGEYNIQPIPSGAGENIAGGQITPEEVMDTWLASPGHYANIMRPDFTGIGVGCYFNPDSDFKFYWVQTFVSR